MVLAEFKEERPGKLSAVGNALAREIGAIVEAYGERLRSDPSVPMATTLGNADLEDHTLPLLADVAQNLVAIDGGEAFPEHLLRDGGEIQRVISNLHGAQRARLGWTEEAIRRDFHILREEVEAGLRRGTSPSDDIGGALRLLVRFLEQAERTSLESFRRAGLKGSS